MAVDMTSEELRAHLFRSLQGRGVLDSVKSQLRSKLATELQRTLEASNTGKKLPPSPSPTKPIPPGRPFNSMTLQVANSIIAEHLKTAGYEYTLSVFLPDAGINVDKLFPSDELLQFLKIDRSSPLHVSVRENEEQGFLVSLLEGLSAHSGVAPRMECAAVQTGEEFGGGMKQSVATKLQALEEAYAQKAEEENKRHQRSLELQMATSQREFEAQRRRQLEAEMANFREWEVSRMRLEEREKYQEEVARIRVELQGSYRQKLEAVRKMELETLERLRRKEQDLEAGIYSQRQALLDELEALKVREAGLQRQAELSRRAATLEEEQVRSMGEQLAARERALQQLKEQYEQMAEERVRKHKLDYDSEMEAKRDRLTRWEVELSSKQEHLSSLRSECQRLEEEGREERGKVERLQGLLHEATTKQVSLQHEKDALQQRMEEMADYQHLRRSVPELQKQLASLQRKLSETKSELKKKLSDQQQLTRQLQSRLTQPSPEQVALQAELDQIRRRHHRELLVAEYENRQLKEQLGSQVEHSLQLQLQLEEQTVQLRSAQREVEDLHSQLERFQAVFLQGRKQELPRRSTTEGGGRRANAAHAKKVATASTVDPAPLTLSSSHPPQQTSRHSHKLLLTASSASYTDDHGISALSPDLNFSGASGQLLVETRATFARLEKEAEELERAYQQIQQGMAGTPPQPHHFSSILPEPDSSPPRPPPLFQDSPVGFSPCLSPPRLHPPTTFPSSLPPPLLGTTSVNVAHPRTVWTPSAPQFATAITTAGESQLLHVPSSTAQQLGHSPSPTGTLHLLGSYPPPISSLPPGIPPAKYATVASVRSQPTLLPASTALSPSFLPTSATTTSVSSHSTPLSAPVAGLSHPASISHLSPSYPVPVTSHSHQGHHYHPSTTSDQSLHLVSTLSSIHEPPPPTTAVTTSTLQPATAVLRDPMPSTTGSGEVVLPFTPQVPPTTAPQTDRGGDSGAEAMAAIADTQPDHLQHEALGSPGGGHKGVLTAQPPTTGTSQPFPVPHSTKSHSPIPVTGVSLDDLWKTPTSVPHKRTSQLPESSKSTPPVPEDTKAVAPGKLSTRVEPGETSVNQKPLTSSREANSPLGQGDPLGRSWERGRRERMEEQARRQREEAERVRRELEEMEEEERRQAAIPSTTSLRTEDVPPIDDHRTKPMQYQPVDEQGGKEEEEEEEEEEEKEEEEEEKTDSVMRKYMEIVSQRREQQKAATAVATHATHSDNGRETQPENGDGKDYDLSPSQVSESYGGFSDREEGDPFEDW